jgi:NADH-quinone oxidoreductase subunit E
MLTEQERKDLEEKIKSYRHREASKITVLNYLQEQRGWISDETMEDAADFIGISTTELASVASFYNLIYRKPVGKKVVHICESATCWMMGEPEIRRTLEETLDIKVGETTKDGEYTLLPIVCLGNCDHSPCMLKGKELVNDLTPDKVKEVLK